MEPSRSSIAIAPFADQYQRLTPCSETLADKVTASLLAASYRVSDRQTLRAALKERDLAKLFDSLPESGSLPASEWLIVGRYAVVRKQVQLRIKVVKVSTNHVVLQREYVAAADRELAAMAMPPPDPSNTSPATTIDVSARGVRIRASYHERNSDQFHLLDRVRQSIRRRLQWYVREGLGQQVSDEGIERLFRGGAETYCEFGSGTVVLEMEFEVKP